MELQVMVPNQETGVPLTVSEQVFGSKLNKALIHQVITAYLAGGRAGTKAQKTRAEVSGGGKKPWRQKGTGRARAGTIRSPLWRKGGKTFAATPRDYTQKVNKKMYRQALRSIVSELIRQSRLTVLSEFALVEPKTKLLKAELQAIKKETDVLIVTDCFDRSLYLAARNVPLVEVKTVRDIDPVCLLNFEHIIFTASAIQRLEERLK